MDLLSCDGMAGSPHSSMYAGQGLTRLTLIATRGNNLPDVRDQLGDRARESILPEARFKPPGFGSTSNTEAMHAAAMLGKVGSFSKNFQAPL